MIKLSRFPRIFGRKKKKLRVGVGRRATAPNTALEDVSEPNMKLSRALLIVLLLHVVAVAGIIAFNAIKSRQSTAPARTVRSDNAAVPKPSPTDFLQRDEARLGRSPSAKIEKKLKAAETPVLPEGGRYYTVAKGDNPVTIAKRFKVPYDDLLAANHIDDPRKLQVGQRLIIPPKKPKKS